MYKLVSCCTIRQLNLAAKLYKPRTTSCPLARLVVIFLSHWEHCWYQVVLKGHEYFASSSTISLPSANCLFIKSVLHMNGSAIVLQTVDI